jgi:ribonuclease P protein component
MLTRNHRLTSSAGFAQAVRRGRRAGTRTLVLHLDLVTDLPAEQYDAEVGFVVSKAIGNAVTRNRVKRRLREIVRERLGELPGASVLVVRALPAAAGASYQRLADDVDAALHRVSGADRPGSRVRA